MIQFSATCRHATVQSTEPITTGSVGIPVQVSLSPDFDGLQTVLVFLAGSRSRDVALMGQPVTVPPEVLLREGETLHVGAYARNGEGDVVIPTVWAAVGKVREGCVPSGARPAEPTPDVIAQIQKAAADARALAGEVAEGARGLLAASRVTSLDGTALAAHVIDAVGIPVYVSDVSEYAAYGITESGWYVFARVTAPEGVVVTDATAVTGAAGSIVTAGADHVDVAVRFEVAAMAQAVSIAWDAAHADSVTFSAPDLAVRNLDYRVTFYVYDIAPFVTWEYVAASDATFTAGKHYYTLGEDGAYQLAEPGSYVIGDPIPADTYYVHSKATFEGMARNVTYQCSTPIDCPSEFILPEVEDETHGCWFEIRFLHEGSYSSTLVPPSPEVKVATEHTQAETKGINMVDLHYTSVSGQRVWRFMNTHSNFTPYAAPLESIAFRKAPAKVAYSAGETLDITGAEVVATYADGTKKLVTPTYAPANGAALTADTTELVASYTEGEVTATASTGITVGGE